MFNSKMYNIGVVLTVVEAHFCNKQMNKGSLLSQLKKERPSQQMASGGSSSMFVCKDPAALASFSLDMELERCRQRGKPEQRSQGLMTQDQTANFTYAEVSPVQ